jgi:hypothetical protein
MRGVGSAYVIGCGVFARKRRASTLLLAYLSSFEVDRHTLILRLGESRDHVRVQ